MSVIQCPALNVCVCFRISICSGGLEGIGFSLLSVFPYQCPPGVAGREQTATNSHQPVVGSQPLAGIGICPCAQTEILEVTQERIPCYGLGTTTALVISEKPKRPQPNDHTCTVQKNKRNSATEFAQEVQNRAK